MKLNTSSLLNQHLAFTLHTDFTMYYYDEYAPDSLHEAFGFTEECTCGDDGCNPMLPIDEDTAVFYENMGMTVY